MLRCIFSPDGSRLVSAARDRTLKVWDAYSGAELGTLRGHQNEVKVCIFSPDGSRIISADCEDLGRGHEAKGMIKVWDCRTRTELFSMRKKGLAPRQICFSKDGLQILAWWSVWKRGQLVLVNALTGTELTTLSNKWGYSCAFTPDNQRVVSASYNGNVEVHDARTGSLLSTIPSGDYHASPHFAISPDACRLLRVCDEPVRTLRLFDLVTGRGLATYFLRDWYNIGISWSRCGRRLVAGGGGHNDVCILALEGTTVGKPIATVARLWLFGKDGNPGHPDDKLTVQCRWCGKRFEVTEDVLGKEVNCSYCSKPLKLNPFKVEPPPL